MSIERWVAWMAATRGSIALHESVYMYVIVESVHVLTLCVFIGFTAMLDLRLLGVAMGSVSVSRLVTRLLPWTVAGFVFMVVSGALLFYAIPVRSYHSVFFRVKMILLILAGVNAWIFHSGVWRRAASWDQDVVPPRAARLAGAASLMLWIGIIFAGRLIAYNWFDCDKAQSAFVQWAAGCPSER